MRVEIGEFKHELDEGHQFKAVISYIESVYAKKCKDIGTDFPPNHVFDEDKSVRWNREKVEAENASKTAARDKARLERITMREQFYNYIKSYVEESLDIIIKDSELINELVRYLKNHFDYEWPDYLDETITLIKLFR